jgi:hypothetical protein
MATCIFTGQSGAKYEYHVFDFGTQFTSEKPGNYAFTRRSAELKHTVLYFGQTKHLKNRCCDTHHKWANAEEYGATHILAHLSDADEAVRCAEESDLIARYKPPLNDQG